MLGGNSGAFGLDLGALLGNALSNANNGNGDWGRCRPRCTREIC